MSNKSQEQGSSTQASKKDMTPVYEVAFHIVPTVPEDALAAVVEKIKAAITSTEIISEQAPAKMTLAYTIERATAGKREKYTEAYFGFMLFAAERENIPAFEEALRAMPEVLRYLLISTTREEAVAPRRGVVAAERVPKEKPSEEGEKVAEAVV